MAAYCIRQAAVEIFGGSIKRKRLGVLSKQVAKAKQRLPADDHPDYKKSLKGLLSDIGELEAFFNAKNIHQARLAARIKNKSGQDPLSGDHSLKAYDRLISKIKQVCTRGQRQTGQPKRRS